jgi:hypothetical protein
MSDRKPGLPAIHQLRADRERGKYSRATGNLFLVGAVCLVAVLLGYRFFSGRQLGEAKTSLLAKQRAVATTLGAQWYPVRDRIEKLTTDAAAHYDGDHVEAEALAGWEFRSLPGLYLRLRVEDAKDVPALRRAAQGSLRDGFVACLLHEPNVAATKGEADSGVFAEQPWNWTKAYAATRILTDEWVAEVRDAGDDLRLRVFEQQYDKAVKEEIPLAIDILQRAEFFLLVLDEGSGEAAAEAGAPASDEDLQEVAHFARVHLLNLKTGKEVLRLRRNAEASFVFAGERPVNDPETITAMKRQVNNCALAKAVDTALASTH